MAIKYTMVKKSLRFFFSLGIIKQIRAHKNKLIYMLNFWLNSYFQNNRKKKESAATDNDAQK